MFFGENIQYYISEENGGQIQMSETSRILNHDVYNKDDVSSFNLLNQMLISNTLLATEGVKQTMKNYASLDDVTKTIFKLL